MAADALLFAGLIILFLLLAGRGGHRDEENGIDEHDEGGFLELFLLGLSIASIIRWLRRNRHERNNG